MDGIETTEIGHAAQQDELSPALQASEDLDLLEILLILSESRKRLLVYTLGGLLLGTVLAFVLKPTFTAGALILPPQQSQSSATAMLGQLGSLASLASGGTLKSPADLYVGILGSRSIADDVIGKFHLAAVYKTTNAEDTRKKLKSNTRVLATNDGMIHILVDDYTAQRASDIANAYVDELHAMNSHLTITEAAQRRVFFDQELAAERQALSAAETDLKQEAEKSGVIQLGSQTEAVIRSIASIRAQIVSQQVQLQAMRTFATDQNPEAVQAQEQIRALQGQLAQLEKDPRNTAAGSPELAAGEVPSLSLTYARKLRELKYHETLFELLSRQYEAARIDEAKASPVIQVVDRAIPPDKKSGPPRLVLIAGSALIGLFLGSFAALMSRLLHKMEGMPNSRLARLRLGLRGGRAASGTPRTPRVP